MNITVLQAQAISNSPIFGMRMAPAVSFKFAQLAKTLQAELKTADEERLKLILAHHGVLSEDKTLFSFPPEEVEGCNASMEALQSSHIEISGFWPMPLEKLGALELSPAELLALEPLLSVEG